MENPIPEKNQREIQRILDEKKSFALFLHTPLCGTCKVGERMLQIVYSMHPNLSIYKGDLNFLPGLAQAWQVMSVPCLAIIRDGKPERKVYAMGSVVDLLQELKPLLPDPSD